MDAHGYQTPDLASVLRTLAQYVPAAPQSNGLIQEDHTRYTEEAIEEGEYDPSEIVDAIVQEPLISSVPPTTSVQRPPQFHRSAPAPAIDPRTITDWPSALRHVMKTVARSDAIMARVKRMIKVQYEHEQQWWEGRQGLLRKQEGREEGRKKLDEVLYAHPIASCCSVVLRACTDGR